MTEPTVAFRIDFWKPTLDGQHITPCAELPDATIIRISIGQGTEIEFLRERDPNMFDSGYQLDRLRRLLQSAFDQGRGAQAKIIRNALSPFG